MRAKEGKGKYLTHSSQKEEARSTQRRARKTWRRNVRQEFGRSPEEIFRVREVFNTGVENFVQKRSCDEVNLPLLNTLMRFAQFLCNAMKRERFSARVNQNGNAKRFVWHEACARENVLQK